jgi:hypothetical protein
VALSRMPLYQSAKKPKLITGAWGALELTKTGIKRGIPEANANK